MKKKPVKRRATSRTSAASGGADASTPLRRQLRDALDRQAATAEILRIISSSPTDLQPVFDAIVQSAKRLLGGFSVVLTRVLGDELHLAAFTATGDAADDLVRSWFPRRLDAADVHGPVARYRSPLRVRDVERFPMLDPATLDMARARGFRSLVAVPMLRGTSVIGTIAVTRREAGPVSDDDVALLQTFADQAVIAIENARLVTELQARNSDLATALDRQTATAEILRVISQSPTDVQPVFDTIVRNAVRLCGASHGGTYHYDGALVHSVAHEGYTAEDLERWRRSWPRPVTASSAACQAIRNREVVRIRDVEAASDADLTPETKANLLSRGSRSVLSVPMLRQTEVIGAISIAQPRVDAFSDAHVELLQTFADQAVIAIENVRLFTELRQKNAALTEALNQQTATGEILRTISGSPNDLAPVFSTILSNATRLCDAQLGNLFLYDGDAFEAVAHHGATQPFIDLLRGPLLPGWGTGVRRLIRERRPLHVPDVRETAAFRRGEAYTVTAADLEGIRTFLAVPMVKDGRLVGVITIYRREVRRFSASQIALVETFADQAVIAIENVRLFTELQAKNRALTESLEQQIATAEILRVISQSQTDAQPVFDTIVRNARQLCGASHGGVYRYDGELVHSVAHDGYTPEQLVQWRSTWPRPATANGAACQAIRTRNVVRVADIDAASEIELTAETRANLRSRGSRSILGVPMFRHGEIIGAIALAHPGVDAFSDAHVELLRTFADQAVIAIENVRLFTELQARNHDLTTALERQTATGEILRVISQSRDDVKPVFDTIADSARRLLNGWGALVARVHGERLEVVAISGGLPGSDHILRDGFPTALDPKHLLGRAILDREVTQITDVETEDVAEEIRTRARARGWRANLAVPMMHGGQSIGALTVTRREPGPFSPQEIELLETFAEQAVIAIENVRLVKELQARTSDLTRSVDELTALGEVSRAVSSTLDLDTVLSTIVSRAVQLSGSDAGSIWEYDEAAQELHRRATYNFETELADIRRQARFRHGEGALGRAVQTRQPVQFADILPEGVYESPLRDLLIGFGYRSLLAVPLVREEQVIGALIVNRKTPGEFAPQVVELLKTFATQSTLAIQNARLFREIEQKSRELETASRHKSEFLANMSHELRTPLNAIIGFSDVLLEGMFGEINAKQTEYLEDILTSGKHLLSLINDILDLSKIEAGRMELDLDVFDLATAIDNALILVRERATRRGITLGTHVDARVHDVRADERKVKQVLLNLLSNALKFTPEGGRVDLTATLANGAVEISIADTGIGIAPEDQAAIFEEFRQVGSADKKAEGTGLGLALSRKFVELHGGKIWVKSQRGVGSTFTFTLPTHHA